MFIFESLLNLILSQKSCPGLIWVLNIFSSYKSGDVQAKEIDHQWGDWPSARFFFFAEPTYFTLRKKKYVPTIQFSLTEDSIPEPLSHMTVILRTHPISNKLRFCNFCNRALSLEKSLSQMGPMACQGSCCIFLPVQRHFWDHNSLISSFY